MADTTCHMSISLDGYTSGPEQSREHPLGRRGHDLHAWHMGDSRATDADATAADWLGRQRGAVVMGRNMFGPIRGEWDEPWDGWWGAEPPYRAPVFVLTHHEREPIEMQGGTTFHFVTEVLTPPMHGRLRSPTVGGFTSPGARRRCAKRSSQAWSTSSP